MNKYLLRTLAPGLLIATGTFFSQATLWADDARKVTQAEAMKQAVAKPQPDYPAIARQLKLEGRVEIEASISEDGSVEGVKILNGNAVLTNAAAAAMKRWKFQPFTDSGKPVRAVATLTFTFKL
ncbi:MAG: TonB family protein [Bryobacterales bacterium]|nr:TonB family protein [Bryobacterales bacterium]